MLHRSAEASDYIFDFLLWIESHRCFYRGQRLSRAHRWMDGGGRERLRRRYGRHGGIDAGLGQRRGAADITDTVAREHSVKRRARDSEQTRRTTPIARGLAQQANQSLLDYLVQRERPRVLCLLVRPSRRGVRRSFAARSNSRDAPNRYRARLCRIRSGTFDCEALVRLTWLIATMRRALRRRSPGVPGALA